MAQHSPAVVKEFYNKYTERQKRIGKNLRHYFLFNQIVKNGLKRRHKILEIGCGIGTFTELLADYIKSGKIVGTDISDGSIKMAEQFFSSKKNMEFFTTDMSDFSYPDKFDFIVAADVLEHIPIESHPGLFRTFAQQSHDSTTIFINIPHPLQIEILQKEAPETLQIIDQALHTDVLLKAAYEAGFILDKLTSYKLFQEHQDYQLIIFKKLRAYNHLRPTSKWSIILEKIRYRIFHFFSTI